MANTKQYASPEKYEEKLQRVMDRLSIDKFDWDYNRHGAWITFWYKGELYKFEQTIEKAKARGLDLKYGSDAFAQLVLALEDLVRLVERGIYDLQSWVSGMKALPDTSSLPWWVSTLNLKCIPTTYEEITSAFKKCALTEHPDKGGTDERFILLKRAKEEAESYVAKAYQKI